MMPASTTRSTNDRPPGARAARSARRERTRRHEDAGVDLDALQQRESWAIRRWIYAERTYVRCVLARHGTDEDELADLVQEVFYQAIRSLPSFKGNAKVTTWLYSIARNVAYSHQRDAKPHRRLTDDLLRHLQSDETSRQSLHAGFDGPREDTIRRERSSMIETALDDLPAHYAEIIRLREQSTTETAEALGITEVNARVRLHRARKALRERLQGYVSSI
jgi:RNA polymerase sigma-70 factor (ECF subfamily)